jgi:hypothetical protein
MDQRTDAEHAADLADTIPARLTALGQRLPAEDRAELAGIVADLHTFALITSRLVAR